MKGNCKKKKKISVARLPETFHQFLWIKSAELFARVVCLVKNI